MKRNSRFFLALHTLCHMAGHADRVWTSAEIAAHAGTNPVVVRRVLGYLRKAGLLTSEKGHAGGWRLARAPQEITLADVYLALEERLVASKDVSDAPECAVESAVIRRVSGVFDAVEQQLIARLGEVTISDAPGDKPL